MTASRDPDQLIHQFLLEGEEQLHDQIYDAVRADIEQQRQRVVIGPWRMPDMNKIVPIGLGAAAVVGALVIGTQLLGPAAPAGVGGAPSAEPSPAAATSPSASAWAGAPAGPFVVTGANAAVRVTVDIGSPDWFELPGLDAITKDDDGLDPPVSVGAAFLGWSWPAGTGINVYGDACQWQTTVPETPATTPDEIAAAFVAQESSDATEPTDVTVGGFAGKAITLEVPISFDKPNATREERFADCDDDVYAFYGIEGEPVEARNAQGAGQIDELWILDVDRSIVILDGAYSPATPADLVDEVRALAASATFE